MQGIAQMYDAKAIASHVKRSLRGLKLVAYYGCLMSRPAELMQFGDPENPTPVSYTHLDVYKRQ